MSAKIQWFGRPGHFIGALNCCFRLHTRVGKYRISSVGCYHPDKPDKAVEIGFGRLYETFVFRLGKDGQPKEWTEIEGIGSNSEDEANAAHEKMVAKYARRKS